MCHFTKFKIYTIQHKAGYFPHYTYIYKLYFIYIYVSIYLYIVRSELVIRFEPY